MKQLLLLSLFILTFGTTQTHGNSEKCIDNINGYLSSDGNCYCNEGYNWFEMENKCGFVYNNGIVGDVNFKDGVSYDLSLKTSINSEKLRISNIPYRSNFSNEIQKSIDIINRKISEQKKINNKAYETATRLSGASGGMGGNGSNNYIKSTKEKGEEYLKPLLTAKEKILKLKQEGLKGYDDIEYNFITNYRTFIDYDSLINKKILYKSKYEKFLGSKLKNIEINKLVKINQIIDIKIGSLIMEGNLKNEKKYLQLLALKGIINDLIYN